ncbi:MAG: protein-disulfide reductase DsbD domain-containing protein [Sphingomonadales bacterium]
MEIFSKFGTFLISLALATGIAEAEEASEWDEGDFSKARLIASHKAVPGENGETLYIGFQVKMKEGWKTYWRTPGSAGLPPVFNWQGSVNLGLAEIKYPAPERFEIFDLQTYGYPDEVIYPIKIAPAVPDAPITLNAEINYLVCKDLCVPAVANLTLTIPAAKGEAPFSLFIGVIETYLAKVPKSEGRQVEVSELKLLGPAGIQNLVFRLKGQNLMTGADIIVEDLENFKFGIPKRRVLTASNEAEFVIPISAIGAEKNIAGQKVVVTLMDGWGNLDEREFILNQE